jgi:4-hydroxybenzoate polyprenyltransferase
MPNYNNTLNVIQKYDIYRIRNWFYYLGFPIIGILLQDSYKSVFINPAVIITSFVLAFIYSLNDYVDGDSNKKYFLTPLLLFFLCIIFLKTGAILALFLFMFFHIIYSLKPLRFKRFPVIGTLCNALAFPQLFLAGYFDKSYVFDSKSSLIFLFLFLLSYVVEILHEISHRVEDIDRNFNTTAVVLKDYQLKLICTFMLIGSVVISYLLYNNRWISSLVFIAFIIFHIGMILEIIYFKLDYKIWRSFRILGIITGIIWFYSMV